jgi:hypothetical protein
MDDQDSTNHGWGYEIGAILHEAELKEEWDECFTGIGESVAAFCSERMDEDIEDSEEGIFMVFAITDCITNLHHAYGPLLARMNAISAQARKSRKTCKSSLPELPDSPPRGLWEWE